MAGNNVVYSLANELPEDEAHPPELGFDCEVLEVAFHPHQQIVAAGLISGQVEVYRFANGGNTRVALLTHHKKSCRALAFSSSGSMLFTGSSDKSLQAIDVATATAVFKEKKAHRHVDFFDGLDPINTLLRLNENVLATGDDGGAVKLWDLRKQGVVRSYEGNQGDFISDLCFVEGENTLLATSGDGSLAVYDVRHNKPHAVSEQLDDELLSIAVVKNNSKVICGSQDGILNIYSWGQWDDISDRFPGHPSSVDALVPIDDQLLITGSSDGLIRVLTMFPNEFVGVVGEHAEFPIERIRLAPTGNYLASCSHDNTVKFWNIQYLHDDDGDDGEDDEEQDDGDEEMDDSASSAAAPPAAADDMDVEEQQPAQQTKKSRPKKKEKPSVSGDFFADM